MNGVLLACYNFLCFIQIMVVSSQGCDKFKVFSGCLTSLKVLSVVTVFFSSIILSSDTDKSGFPDIYLIMNTWAVFLFDIEALWSLILFPIWMTQAIFFLHPPSFVARAHFKIVHAYFVKAGWMLGENCLCAPFCLKDDSKYNGSGSSLLGLSDSHHCVWVSYRYKYLWQIVCSSHSLYLTFLSLSSWRNTSKLYS